MENEMVKEKQYYYNCKLRYLKENIWMEKDGMEIDIISMIISNLK